MSKLRNLGVTASVLASLTLLFAGACSDDPMGEGVELGPDSGAGVLPDAAPAIPDAAALPDASDPDIGGGDFPVELACSLDDVQPILECVVDNCLDSIADNNLLTCVTLSCGLLLLTMPPECSQCILTGLTDTSMALDACVTGLDDLGMPPSFP